MRVVAATRNPGKLAELSRLLRTTGWDLLPLAAAAPEPVEDGDSYLANAVAKARSAAAFMGLPAVADDSGIEVEALDGFPGLRSARWTLADGPMELLRRAAELPPERRAVCMRAAVALAFPGGLLLSAEGRVDGTLTTAPRGAGGFGYDVIFELAAGRTLAEVDPAVKDRIGHRGRAVAALITAWRVAGSPEI